MSEEEYSEVEHSKRLSATMAMLSETYPIIVYFKKAIACGLPAHFMDLRYLPDKWGRVPCKREAMDWYLENSVVDEETKAKIDLKIKKDLESAGYVSVVTVDSSEQEQIGDNSFRAGSGQDTTDLK